MIILLGLAGTGKSTQGRRLADEYGFAWISTGEILRVLITGSRRQEMLQGNLLNDDEMITVMDKVMDLINPNDEFVLDGFPRTLAQTKWLISQAERGRFTRILVFHLKAAEQVVAERLHRRGRQDDNDQAIAKRFEEYQKETLPILEALRQHHAMVYDIDASESSDKVHQAIYRIIESLPTAPPPKKG